MPGAIRPDKKLMKIAYTILKTNDNMRQKNETSPTEERRKEWRSDSDKA